MFCKKSILRNFAKFTGKHLCQSLFFNKNLRPQHAILLKKRLLHKRFPVNFAKFLRTHFLQKTSACNFIKKETFAQVFYCKFCEMKGINHKLFQTGQIYSNKRVATQVNTDQHESTQVRHVSTQVKSQHELT